MTVHNAGIETVSIITYASNKSNVTIFDSFFNQNG